VGRGGRRGSERGQSLRLSGHRARNH
jgi:hypothetical protein